MSHINRLIWWLKIFFLSFMCENFLFHRAIRENKPNVLTETALLKWNIGKSRFQSSSGCSRAMFAELSWWENSSSGLWRCGKWNTRKIPTSCFSNATFHKHVILPPSTATERIKNSQIGRFEQPKTPALLSGSRICQTILHKLFAESWGL